MAVQPIFYRRPELQPAQLTLQPRLASWNAAGHPDQLRLAEALEDAATALAPVLDVASGPMALRLDVGLGSHLPLLAEHDLDNYVFPLASHIGRRTGAPLVSVWCTKQASDASFVRMEPAGAGDAPSPFVRVRTTASASTTAYKREIHDQLADISPLPDGAVALELAFVVGPRRNWLNLWKPTLDALDGLLGRTRPDREWHPRDGRITDLGLHRVMDAALGSDVVIDVVARQIPM